MTAFVVVRRVHYVVTLSDFNEIQSHVSLLLIPGAIFSGQSTLHIEGDTMFTGNSAQHDGGEA